MTAALAPGAKIADHVWRTKYRAPGEAEIADSERRVAAALAAVEPGDQGAWARRFADLLADRKFIPGGRILAGAGTGRDVTLFNCFVMGPIEDSIRGILRALQESAVTMQQGGGVGLDFSTLRPSGTTASRTGGVASGPVSFMALWDVMCETLLSTGARRGAMMGTLRCDHPDIGAFVEAKRAGGRLTHFNLSVLVTDAFMSAVRSDEPWTLTFRGAAHSVVPARRLWTDILEAAYDSAEPGVLFIDRINAANPLGWREQIHATNPCGEVPLPAYGVCDLGSFNLVRFVRAPFTRAARLDFDALREAVPTAVRLLDNVIDASRFPLPQQAEAERRTRRIGLGITGLADALVMLGLEYGAPPSLELAGETAKVVRDAAYLASIELAREKGCFPNFERDRYLAGEYAQRLPAEIRDGVARHGLRNSHCLAIAPAGTISLLAGNVSSGIEPIFASEYERWVVTPEGARRRFELTDWALAAWRASGVAGEPPAFMTVGDVSASAQIEMQAALQPFVDNAISKTVSVPQSISFERFRGVYDLAYDRGLKGCAVFRPNPVTGAVLTVTEEAGRCCSTDRESD
jgi:ribonucleoside-diphosphate reductase alpha chain